MNTKTKMTVSELTNIVAQLEKRVEELEKRPVRDRGPASERMMTEEDAKRVMIGDMKDTPHKKAAEELGLSYGQIYSARNGFTFKKVYKEMINNK